MINKPPYVINENILNLVTTITEKLTRLEISADFKKDLLLRKASKIKSVNSSCAIEANRLSEEEVMDIIEGKMVIAPRNEIDEVKNAYNAYSNIQQFDPFSIESFLKAHKMLTTDLIKESGQFRSGDVGVLENDKVIHIGARPEYVYELVEDLFSWAINSNLNPLIKSSVIHFEIEFIHPFSDGNGRIGRLWQSLLLCKYHYLFEYLPIESLVYEHQQQYYEALSKAEKEASSTVFIEFMLKMILKIIEKFESNSSLNKIKDIYFNDLTKTEKEVLNALVLYFDKKEFLDSDTASRFLNKSKVNIRKYFGKLMKADILIPIGENKGRKYKLNDKVRKDE